jgi:hypothetical protein
MERYSCDYGWHPNFFPRDILDLEENVTDPQGAAVRAFGGFQNLVRRICFHRRREMSQWTIFNLYANDDKDQSRCQLVHENGGSKLGSNSFPTVHVFDYVCAGVLVWKCPGSERETQSR